ncbi:hypothetical protein ERICIV_02072 [Paenibacillus larvae subsp. larvae]|uniref:Uncharacterized protein n=1 Tax=Paenibacillus larvae subsp. larvae TaxID=147375 RepID=A0A2L1UDI0_9BACL|nr:hypothetical protein [Paenibacillus larvae]AVF26218.1 hypothetical protein ERICIII_02051 [Paenibacillus larvae subsp. larvae]AVF30995.1 hypothetical protein ERICIV_02072 [Paenibacillus larvae subsp. larvae]MCY7521866.1 hypothetical protein [Paenibacillus larvae]MCY9502360.1 hypothetical protein [Paenibacillus larvae]MCY9511213.1 hypothetical protein [Paenibacillus larvae]
MPGGASNTGADWVSAEYAGADLNAPGISVLEMTETDLRWHHMNIAGHVK